MKKISIIALLYVIAAMPVFAADDKIKMLSEPEADKPSYAVDDLKADAARLSRFSLLQVGERFSLYGKLSAPRITEAETGAHRNTVTYGLHGQFDSTPGIGLRFGWDRYVSGQNSSDNLYSLTATIKY